MIATDPPTGGAAPPAGPAHDPDLARSARTLRTECTVLGCLFLASFLLPEILKYFAGDPPVPFDLEAARTRIEALDLADKVKHLFLVQMDACNEFAKFDHRLPEFAGGLILIFGLAVFAEARTAVVLHRLFPSPPSRLPGPGRFLSLLARTHWKSDDKAWAYATGSMKTECTVIAGIFVLLLVAAVGALLHVQDRPLYFVDITELHAELDPSRIPADTREFIIRSMERCNEVQAHMYDSLQECMYVVCLYFVVAAYTEVRTGIFLRRLSRSAPPTG